MKQTTQERIAALLDQHGMMLNGALDGSVWVSIKGQYNSMLVPAEFYEKEKEWWDLIYDVIEMNEDQEQVYRQIADELDNYNESHHWSDEDEDATNPCSTI